METRAAYVVVGGFVLALIAGLVVAALWVAHGQFTKAQTRYDIYFASVTTGLVDGSVVQISGVQVGRVVEVALDPANPQRVRVTVEVKSDSPIRSDSVASIDIQTLTGTAAVAISPGSSAAPPIELTDDQRYPVIWSRDSEIQKVVATIPDLLAKITNLSDRLGDVVDDRNRAALAATLDNLSRISSAVAARSGDLDRLFVEGAADAQELHEVIASMNHAVRRVDTVTDQASNTLDQASNTVRDFDQLVKDNQAPIKDFTQNGLGELRQLLARTETLVTAMTRAADTIERDPSSLLYGDRRQGYRPQ
jgi:phospholipid/cholesterol/gamma-HCH transport system substrate-binding protein